MSQPEPDLARLGLLSSGRDGPVFPAPWAARAFALAVALNERGVFSWTEWTHALGAALAEEDGNDGPEAYWRAWLSALEGMLGGRGIARLAQLHQLQTAWREAAEATPHGEVVELPLFRKAALIPTA